MKVRELISTLPINQMICTYYITDLALQDRFLFKGKARHLKDSSVLDGDIECFFTTLRKDAIYIVVKEARP